MKVTLCKGRKVKNNKAKNKELTFFVQQIHLAETDFEKVFGMSYSDFASKPQWKQQQMKKDAKLF